MILVLAWGGAILSPALMGSAEILNSGTKGLTSIRVNTQYLPKAYYLNGQHLVRRERNNAHFQALLLLI